jgi:hypothetical protein
MAVIMKVIMTTSSGIKLELMRAFIFAAMVNITMIDTLMVREN